MNATWKAVAGVLLVFVLGLVGGSLLTLGIVHHRMEVLIQNNPEPVARLIERQTTWGLGLGKDKKKQVHDLIVANIHQRNELQRQVRPQVKAMNAETMQQINALLTDDQQKRFHENLLTLKHRYGRNPFNVADDDSSPTGAK